MQKTEKFFVSQFSNETMRFQTQIWSAALNLESEVVKSTSIALFNLFNSFSQENMIAGCKKMAEAACNDLLKFMMGKSSERMMLNEKLSELKENKNKIPLEMKNFFNGFLMYSNIINELGNFGSHFSNNSAAKTIDNLSAVSAVCQIAFCLLNFVVWHEEQQKNKKPQKVKKEQSPSSNANKKITIEKKQTSQTTSSNVEASLPKEDTEQFFPKREETRVDLPRTPVKKGLKHKWQRKTLEGEWKDVQVELSMCLEINFVHKQFHFDEEINGKQHFIDLEKMTETVNGNTFSLQRVAFGRRFLWQYVGKKNLWKNFDTLALLLIERNHKNNILNFEIEIREKKFSFDLSRMTQKRAGESTERQIQRIELI